ncbi:hypothetical protein DFP73DRAFT_544828 [Morchella snyderi]|nr:hypothetical protein DFP73DRAFT_544828 [Morchella snyderi]
MWCVCVCVCAVRQLALIQVRSSSQVERGMGTNLRSTQHVDSRILQHVYDCHPTSPCRQWEIYSVAEHHKVGLNRAD